MATLWFAFFSTLREILRSKITEGEIFHSFYDAVRNIAIQKKLKWIFTLSADDSFTQTNNMTTIFNCSDCQKWFDEGKEKCKKCDFDFSVLNESDDDDASSVNTQEVCCECELSEKQISGGRNIQTLHYINGKTYCLNCREPENSDDEEEDEDEWFDRKYPDASCHRCDAKLNGKTVVMCGGGGGECETWYCATCHIGGTHDCLVCDHEEEDKEEFECGKCKKCFHYKDESLEVLETYSDGEVQIDITCADCRAPIVAQTTCDDCGGAIRDTENLDTCWTNDGIIFWCEYCRDEYVEEYIRERDGEEEDD
jgi:hypothetical protein